jgi:exonuclease III
VWWNVRGLGDPDKCALVKDALVSAAPSLICLQETKLHHINQFQAHSFLPPSFTNTIQYISAARTHGGILSAWNSSTSALQSFISRRYTLTTVLASTTSDHLLTVTNVYAPSDHRDSRIFLEDLLELRPHIQGSWVLLGDFKLIRRASDKKHWQYKPWSEYSLQ